ncbi:MAG: PEP-CTERM sorting domain-containing protein [Nitrospirales bacterium]
MKRFATLVCTIGLLIGGIGQVQAASITTTFANNNGQAGNMFDITTFGNALTVNSMDLNLDSGTTNTISVYTRNGTYLGFENNSAGWTLVSQISGVTSAGAGNPTFMDLMDFSLAANSVTGIYVTTGGPTDMNYTNGANTFANADLRLDLGVGKGGLFGLTFTPRTWNGTINYTVDGSGQVGAVPEPGTIVLMGSGLAGLAFWRSRRETENKK